jgi:hypothetical protein
MELLILNEYQEVDINKVWIKTNPKLSVILKRDKGLRKFPTDGSPTYFDKIKAKKEFKLITLLLNPDSEYSNMEEKERLENALLLLKIDRKDFDKDTELMEAISEYEKILTSIASFRSYRAVKKSIDNKINYIEEINFRDVDKQGRLKITPLDHSKAVEGLVKDLKYQRQLEVEYNQEFEEKTNRFKKTLVVSVLESSNNGDNEWIENIESL